MKNCMEKLSKVNKFSKSSIIILSLVSLSACSTHVLNNKDNDYLQTKIAPTIQVPQGVSSAKLGSDYPVSGNIYPNGKAPSIVPPGSLAASGAKK